jgi:hypothetical protein
MNQDGRRDLAWWLLPTWAPALPRIILSTVVATPVAFGIGLLGLIAIEPRFGPVVGLVVTLAIGLTTALVMGLVAGRGGGEPVRMGSLRRGAMMRREVIIGSFVVALVVGLVGGFVFGLGTGLIVGLVGGPLVGLAVGLGRPGVDDVTPSEPMGSWRRDRNYGLTFGFVVGLGTGLLGYAVIANEIGFLVSLGIGLGVGLLIGLLGTATWPTALVGIQWRIAHGTPLRMIRFLEDARLRNVLRTVGPLYQFRHARLQDRLADTALPKPSSYATSPGRRGEN